MIFSIPSFWLTTFVQQFHSFFYESTLTAFLHLCFARDLNVYIKTVMHWFQFPQTQELKSPTVTSFIWQCYSYSVHSVLFIILKIVLLACLNKGLFLRWMFSYLVSLIGGSENEQSLTIFYWLEINIHTCIHTDLFQNSERSRCVVKVD